MTLLDFIKSFFSKEYTTPVDLTKEQIISAWKMQHDSLTKQWIAQRKPLFIDGTTNFKEEHDRLSVECDTLLYDIGIDVNEP